MQFLYSLPLPSLLVHDSPLNSNLVGLFIKLFYDYVNQKFYSAELVGINFAISTNKLGLEVNLAL